MTIGSEVFLCGQLITTISGNHSLFEKTGFLSLNPSEICIQPSPLNTGFMPQSVKHSKVSRDKLTRSRNPTWVVIWATTFERTVWISSANRAFCSLRSREENRHIACILSFQYVIRLVECVVRKCTYFKSLTRVNLGNFRGKPTLTSSAQRLTGFYTASRIS